VIWNLLSNAVKFTPAGGRVSVSLRETGGAVQIVVADSGTGIERGFLPHVFERFSQADSSTTRTHGGLGLGLAIVRHLVDLHGGAVTVDSDGRDRGAVFVVTLPTRRAAAPAVEPLPPKQAVPRLEGVRVLAVDDEEDSRELILMSMRTAGAEVMVVSSAPGALAAFPVFSPHVVVTDLGMPEMDGYTLIREIASLAGQGAPPVIALTAPHRKTGRLWRAGCVGGGTREGRWSALTAACYSSARDERGATAPTGGRS
jgi:CheY-like chemotaxis protein/anti-sigma regulatory factor (Ser/Thr protein kinase)